MDKVELPGVIAGKTIHESFTITEPVLKKRIEQMIKVGKQLRPTQFQDMLDAVKEAEDFGAANGTLQTRSGASWRLLAYVPQWVFYMMGRITRNPHWNLDPKIRKTFFECLPQARVRTQSTNFFQFPDLDDISTLGGSDGGTDERDDEGPEDLGGDTDEGGGDPPAVSGEPDRAD